MHLIGAIIIGFFAGIIAKLLMPGKDPGGFIVTTLLGMGGALLATFLGRSFGWYGPNENAGFLGKHCRSYSDIVFVSDHCQTRGKKNTSSHLFAIINHSFLAMHPFAFSVSL